MTKHLKHTVGIMLGLMIALTTVSDSEARARKFRVNSNDNSFSVSGRMIGSIEDYVRVGGEKVWVSPETSIYVVGEGFKEAGYFVNNQRIYVGGATTHGMKRAAFVIVRKSGETRSQRRSAEPKNVIRTGGSPNAGTLAADTPQ